MNLNEVLFDLCDKHSLQYFKLYVNGVLLTFGRPIEIMNHLAFEFKTMCEDINVINYDIYVKI